MFNQNDIKEILDDVPNDFQKESDEFWNYIESKLRQLPTVVKRIYLVLKNDLINPKINNLILFLQEGGGEVERFSDKTLVKEGWAWYVMSQGSRGFEEDFIEDINKELSNALCGMIDQSLKDFEIGIVFYEPTCAISIGDNIRVIKMTPFDPRDYLIRHLAQKQALRK